LSLVHNGDRIRLSVSQRELQLLVSDEVLAERAAQAPPRTPNPKERGYRKLFLTTVTQADQGCDFDFLQAAEFTGSVPRSQP
jgi:dihydroxy-acid dehydratase